MRSTLQYLLFFSASILRVRSSDQYLVDIDTADIDIWYGNALPTPGTTKTSILTVFTASTSTPGVRVTTKSASKATAAPTTWLLHSNASDYPAHLQVVDVSPWNLTFHPEALYVAPGTILEFQLPRADLLFYEEPSRSVLGTKRHSNIVRYQVCDTTEHIFRCIPEACDAACQAAPGNDMGRIFRLNARVAISASANSLRLFTQPSGTGSFYSTIPTSANLSWPSRESFGIGTVPTATSVQLPAVVTSGVVRPTPPTQSGFGTGLRAARFRRTLVMSVSLVIVSWVLSS